MITEDYVSFETAKLLKEKGFDERCTHYYKNEKYLIDLGYTNIHSYTNSDLVEEFAAPTLQMAMKWLREVHNWHIAVEKGSLGYHINLTSVPKGVVCYITPQITGTMYVTTYEQACEATIKYCLENLI